MMNHSLYNPNDDETSAGCTSSHPPSPCHHVPLSSAVSSGEDCSKNNDLIQKEGQRNAVRFSTVLVFEFPQSLGCGTIPSSGGAPIGLKGFKACRKIKCDVDLFEENRSLNRRSTRNELHLSVETRSRLLVELGHTLDDILDATLEGYKIQQGRIETQVITKLEESRRGRKNNDVTVAVGGRSRGGGKFLARAFVSTKRNLIKSMIRRT